MDIEQLRIGNLIQLGNNITKVVSLDLDLEDEGEPLIKVDTFKNIKSPIGGYWKEYTELNYTHFSPIPLTEEWLLKFGFQRHDEGCVSAQFSYGINPVTQDYLIYLKWIKDYENEYQLNGFPFFQNGHFKIKTVHQLQNLFFSLTGEELEPK